MKNLLFFLLFSAIGWAQFTSPAGFIKINTTPITTTTFTDSACPNFTSCFYIVTAIDNAGHESSGGSCSSAQLCFAGDQAVVQMPSSGTHTVILSWTASISTGVTGYNVYRGNLSPPNTIAAVVN